MKQKVEKTKEFILKNYKWIIFTNKKADISKRINTR